MIKGMTVVLRSVEESDLDMLREWINDQDIARRVGGFTFPVSRAEQHDWFLKTQADTRSRRFMIDVNGETIGTTGLWEIDWRNRHALTGIKLGTAASRGRGFGSDAIMALAAYAFQQVGLNRLWTEILVTNQPSYHAYVERCGWVVEGRLRQHVFRDGEFLDQYRIGLLADEFRSQPSSRNYLPSATT